MENTQGDDFSLYDEYQKLEAGKKINLSSGCWHHVGEFKPCPSDGTDCYRPVCAEDYNVDYDSYDGWVDSCEECDSECPTPPPPTYGVIEL